MTNKPAGKLWKELFFWFFIPFAVVGGTAAWYIVTGVRQAGGKSELEWEVAAWLVQFVYFGGIAGVLALLLRLIAFGLAKIVELLRSAKRT